MRFIILIVSLCLFANQHATLDAQEPQGHLMLIGGAERDDNRLLWDEFVRMAGGKGSTVAILPTASSYPMRTAQFFAAHFERLGLHPIIIPASKLIEGVQISEIVRDPQWISKIESADAVFLAGGEQARYREALIDTDGNESPMLKSIRQVYQSGGLIAGTSAGMAVMSRIMFIDAEQMLPVLQHGVQFGKQIDHGLGLLPSNLFVDQHFLTRGRFGRALVVMQDQNFPFGIGVDEDSALVIEHQKKATVVGYRGALVMDASHALQDPQQKRFHWKGVKLSFLSHGDELDLETLEVHPAPEKTDKDRVDPYAPDFKPYYLLPQHYNDIFANTQLLDLLYKLVDSPFEEAIGMAYDGALATTQEVDGFRFRFYRQPGTLSWDSPAALGDSHTIVNVYMDIEPIRLRQQLGE